MREINGYFKKSRVLEVCAVLILFSCIVFLRYATLAFSKKTEIKQTSPQVLRGSIVDKNGKPLAVPTNFYHVGVTPSAIKNKDYTAFASLYAGPLEMNKELIVTLLRESEDAQFIYLKKKVDQNTYEILKEITDKNGYFSAVRFDRIPGRVYPENSLASQVIGYMGTDGTGLSGIEYSQQDILSPPVEPNGVKDVQGKNVYLTLDKNLQFQLEKIAQKTIEDTNAENIMLIAAEAKTGEILSYISLPSANLNTYTAAAPEEMKDRPATEGYEPGSVFKIFSIASFIDSGAISENDIFFCDGVFEKTTGSGEKIKIGCLDRHGWITARDALKYSCNDALAQMSEKIESEQFLARLRDFGFGEKTGIELPGETSGYVRSTDDRYWSARSKPTISIGQEITVSALQMVQAATAFANGGHPVKLTLIKKIAEQNGLTEYEHIPEIKKQIIKSETADYILSCMETVAKSGTGARANLKDISIGVKTGTAQMADTQNGGYSKTDFISNCIAIFPIEDPQIILYIVITKAQGETYAGRIVAPVIAEAASAIIDYLGMSRGNAASLAHSGLFNIQSEKEIGLASSVPDFTGLPKRTLLQLFKNDDYKVKITGDGYVVSQTPEVGTPLSKGMEIEIFLE